MVVCHVDLGGFNPTIVLNLTFILQQENVKVNWHKEYQEILDLSQHDEVAALEKISDLHRRLPHERNVNIVYANLLEKNKKMDEALAVFENMTTIDADVLLRKGLMQFRHDQLQAAIATLKVAHELDPANKMITVNYGYLLQQNGDLPAAQACFERILEQDPNEQDALFRLAWLCAHRGDFKRALALYERIPNQLEAQTTALFYRHYVMPHRPEHISLAAKKLGQAYMAKNKIAPMVFPKQAKDKPLKIGLVSADLRNHVVSYFIESLLKSQAAKQYTWVAYYNNTIDDTMVHQLKKHVQKWHEIKYWHTQRVVEQIRSDEIDVLVDLSGYTSGGRMDVFAAQAAPVQVTWLGYFGTTGLPTMQAIIADPYCVPQNEEYLYSEKVYRMPHTRLCMTAPTGTLDVSDTVRRKGEISITLNLNNKMQGKIPILSTPALKNGYITFASYQNLLKINDEVLKVWAKIANRLPEARWHFQNGRLQEGSQELADFQKKLRHLGFDLNKVTCVANMTRHEYLSHYNQVDIVLDTFPYNGGTTTAEALSMATPTLTLAMAGMIARQGEQMMCAAGLPEWVCHDEQSYVDKAVYWGEPQNFMQLNAIHMNMRSVVEKSPLFNAEQFAHDWCVLIRKIWGDFKGASVSSSPIIINPSMLAVRKRK